MRVFAARLRISVFELTCLCLGVYGMVTKLLLTEVCPTEFCSLHFWSSCPYFFHKTRVTEKSSERTSKLVLSDHEITSSSLNFSVFRHSSLICHRNGAMLRTRVQHPTHCLTFVEIKFLCPLCLMMVFTCLT